eukprot:2201569-Rhodomonas_salina.1
MDQRKGCYLAPAERRHSRGAGGSARSGCGAGALTGRLPKKSVHQQKKEKLGVQRRLSAQLVFVWNRNLRCQHRPLRSSCAG